jgi:hypothetical protein
LSFEQRGVDCLENMIKTCQADNIQVILTFAPEYSEAQAIESNRGQVFNKFQEIARRYNVPFWDYSQSSFSSNREAFYNSQHLNREGAEAFSADVASRLAEFLKTDSHAQARNSGAKIAVVQRADSAVR